MWNLDQDRPRAGTRPNPGPRRQTPSRLSRSTSASSPGGLMTSREDFVEYLTGVRSPDSEVERSRPQALGIHHLIFAVSNLDIAIAWYERVLGARRIPELDHVDAEGSRSAVVCQMVDWAGLYLELRQDAARATHVRGWAPIVLSVRAKSDLLHWIEWLDRWGTTHSPILSGIRGWVLIFEDPDGRNIRLYTRESHNGNVSVATDE